MTIGVRMDSLLMVAFSAWAPDAQATSATAVRRRPVIVLIRATFAVSSVAESDVKIELTALEARVIGCLIEKGITTPDQYPLSLNALTNACNQKSNRDPVLDLNETTVQQIVDG